MNYTQTELKLSSSFITAQQQSRNIKKDFERLEHSDSYSIIRNIQAYLYSNIKTTLVYQNQGALIVVACWVYSGTMAQVISQGKSCSSFWRQAFPGNQHVSYHVIDDQSITPRLTFEYQLLAQVIWFSSYHSFQDILYIPNHTNNPKLSLEVIIGYHMQRVHWLTSPHYGFPLVINKIDALYQKLLGIKWAHHVWNDDARWKREGKQSNHIFRLLFKHGVSPVPPYCANVRRIRCKADLNSFPLGELEETTGMPPYYVDEDYPAGPGIIEPLPEWSNWLGSESSTLENDVYVWCYYALIVVQARNEWMSNQHGEDRYIW